jgi:hypothetical protein
MYDLCLLIRGNSMTIQQSIIIGVAIITAGVIVSSSLKPAQAFGDGTYSMVRDGDKFVWVLNTDKGDIKWCNARGMGGEPVCSPWSE